MRKVKSFKIKSPKKVSYKEEIINNIAPIPIIFKYFLRNIFILNCSLKNNNLNNFIDKIIP